jgi:hypothetical protein
MMTTMRNKTYNTLNAGVLEQATRDLLAGVRYMPEPAQVGLVRVLLCTLYSQEHPKDGYAMGLVNDALGTLIDALEPGLAAQRDAP